MILFMDIKYKVAF